MYIYLCILSMYVLFSCKIENIGIFRCDTDGTTSFKNIKVFSKAFLICNARVDVHTKQK